MDKKKNALRGLIFMTVTSVICGAAYTAVVTGLSKVMFPRGAGAGIICIDGKAAGSELLGQRFMAPEYLHGREMYLDLSTFKAEDGTPLMYATPSNLSPASDEYAKVIEERVKKVRAENPEMADKPVPSELVTCSGSGLDPHISPAAAEYQTARIARARGITGESVREAISLCTDKKFMGIFGEETVNVLKVNLALDGRLAEED